MRESKEKLIRKRLLVGGALLFVQVLFGIHYIATKVIVQSIEPSAWAMIRVVGAAVVLLPIALLSKKPFPKSRVDLGKIFIFAVFGVMINQTLFIEGMARTVPSHSALINTLIPIATLLFALILGREHLTLPRFIGISLAFSGVLYLLFHRGVDLSGGFFVGDLLTLANATSFSFYLVISRPLTQKYSSVTMTALLMSFGAIGVSAYGLKAVLNTDFASVSMPVWAWAAFSILGATVLTYFLNVWALRRVESSLVALFIYLQPVIAAVLSATLLNEKITHVTVLSGLLIFAGVFVAVALHRPRHKA